MPFFRAFVAASLVLVPAAPIPEMMVFQDYPLVHRVDCDEGKGSAFRVGENHWLSVAHVTALHGCSIDGNPIHVTEQDGTHDFSRLDTARGVPNALKVDCHGFIPGRWYWAIGYAGGKDYQTEIAVYATFAKTPDGKRVLIGEYHFIPGMSGGPVMDDTGAVVGTVNAYFSGSPISLSRELRDTSVCGADIA